MSGLLRARLAVLGAAVLWSTSGAAIKSVSLEAFQIAGGRALFAALVLGLLLPRARRGWDRRTLAVGAAYAATTVLFVVANTLTTAANAIFLQDTAPLWVLVLAPLILGERPARAELFLAPLFVGGMALFFFERLGPGGALGNAVALLSGVMFALSIMGFRHLRDGAEGAVLAGNLIAVLATLPLALRGPRPTGQDVLVIAFLGVFQLGLAYVLFVRGLRGLTAVEGALLALLEPVLNPLWALLLRGERPGPYAIAGGAVILGATIARALAAPAAPAPPPAALRPAPRPVVEAT